MQSQSDGTMEEMTVESECRDLETVLADAVKMDLVDQERIFFQGESMGELVSALVAALHPRDVKALIFWYPAFSIPEDAKRRHIAAGGTYPRLSALWEADDYESALGRRVCKDFRQDDI